MKDYTKKINSITNKQYEYTTDFNDTILRLMEKYGQDKISNEEFLKVGDFVFNISLVFDEISFSKEEKVNYLMNLFFIEMESNHTKQEIKRFFPSIIKMQTLIESIKSSKSTQDIGYIALADVKNTDICSDEDTGLVFNDIKPLVSYINQFDEVIDLLETFETEVVKYVSKIKFMTISDSEPQSQRSNGGVSQTILFKSDKHLFKISILSESHKFQSYARLSVKDASGWTVVQSFNPVDDFNIDISYKTDIDKKVFKRIINSLFEIADKVENVL